MIHALLPAGGHSLRMGRPKLALPIGGRTVLEQVIHALGQAGIEHVLVVLGPHVADLAPLAQTAGALVVVLPKATPDMRRTIEAGLAWLEKQWQPGPSDSWLLVPADHPTLSPAVVRQLVQARQANPEKSIIIPTFQGRRGHPVLIGWQHVAGIRALPPGQGLNLYLRQHWEQTLELPVESEEILHDLDTPEDYERVRRRWEDGPS